MHTLTLEIEIEFENISQSIFPFKRRKYETYQKSILGLILLVIFFFIMSYKNFKWKFYVWNFLTRKHDGRKVEKIKPFNIIRIDP